MRVGRPSKKAMPLLLDINRHVFGSINPGDVQKLESMGESERRAFVANVHLIFTNPSFKVVLTWLLEAQKDFIATQVPDWEGLLVGRGSVNGISLVAEYLEKLNNEYIESVKPREDFDPHGVIPEQI